MRAVKEARQYIERNPADPSAVVLAKLVLALEMESDFHVTDLYQLDQPRFDLALRILGEWRVDRYYLGKPRLFDVSLQMAEMYATPQPTAAPAAFPAEPTATAAPAGV